ncbi:hypothetical protein EKO04_008263 [Ascochyta lentis]|uniref:Amidohydrolase-related domain-containing protein n=1 Tax=Ascochyta lentis TaxID=205686 RepID=A0A8H7MC98_9PLEO|nr:hypothetical protein EKO04_008263 [Ascochyta lentis]
MILGRKPIRQSFLERENRRWSQDGGQNQTVVLRNASLFDGESFLTDSVNIVFKKGVITTISKRGDQFSLPLDADVYDLEGRFVTPGLVDIHSHHLEMPFSHVVANQDVNEKPNLGPITPFVRAIDGFKPYDPAIQIIASGGVTTSLILPGSGNIIGGQAFLVKNLPNPGENAEPVVEDLLFDHGLPKEERQRYLKMACGENPKYLYGHTRLGNAWLLRRHLEEAQKLKSQQDAWCQGAERLHTGSRFSINQPTGFVADQGELPESLELEATVALLRGDFNTNIHCYEPEDLERMLDVLHEFGVHPQAFHHALEAWQVPEFLKQQERNITIATFAENALYKHEAYGANLRGPKILDDHGVRVVLKSDHTGEGNFAKYLLDQASISHSFGLPEVKALQSVTSAAAYSIQQDHRIGYVRAGYDADLVLWDSHPLAVGATPVQIWIDGREVLKLQDLSKVLNKTPESTDTTVPSVRPVASEDYKKIVCAAAVSHDDQIVFTGIKNVLLGDPRFNAASTEENYAVVVSGGKVLCFDLESVCRYSHNLANASTILLKNGYITPGLIAFGNNIGILDISSEPSTGDGSPGQSYSALDESAHQYAKYGIHFSGRSFERARLGGVTRAITAPNFGSGILQGISVGILTHPNATLLNGGIWKDEVALHMHIGQDSKSLSTPTISSAISRLHTILSQYSTADPNTNTPYARAARGTLPLIIHTINEHDISQIIKLKQEFPRTRIAIFGAHGAHLVAHHLARANIPVILTSRGASDTWEKAHALPGPPLSASPAQVLIDAGVLVALAVRGDSKVWGLAREARWAGKWAGLSEREAIKLVSENFEKILGLEQSSRDFVVWEGSPGKGEGSVVVSVGENGKVVDCLPDVESAVL